MRPRLQAYHLCEAGLLVKGQKCGTWIKTEKAADEKERENQWLRAENSRLRELQNAKYASNGPTEGLDDEDFMGAW